MHRETVGKRMRAKLKDIKQQLRIRMHAPVEETGKWLKSVVQGYFKYYAVPGNGKRIKRVWWHALHRRGQRRPWTWARMIPLDKRWLPSPRIIQSYPSNRFDAKHMHPR
jgi:hypothetical protein